MDSLVAKGESKAPLKRKRGSGRLEAGGSLSSVPHRPVSSSSKSTNHNQKPKASKNSEADATLLSISRSTRTPAIPASKSANNRQAKDLKLRAHLNNLDDLAKESRSLTKDASDLLLNATASDAGYLVPDDPLERTWRVDQNEIARSLGVGVASQRREIKLDGGPYRCRYSRNGRHLAMAGRNGHVASFDPHSGKVHMELQLRESLRDITYLFDQSHIAVAQKQNVFIYDQDGVELHRLSAHIDATRLEFLPYHWLLVSIGNSGYLKYTDTSTGTLVSEHRTKLGACHAMAQNIHNAVIYLGHQNGTITLRTPNLPTPPVTLLAHMGPVHSISVDASPGSGGRYMASSGADGHVKVWDCRNWKGCVREWVPKSQGNSGVGGSAGAVGGITGIEVDYSQKGILGVASGGSVYTYIPQVIRNEHTGAPPVYLTHSIPQRPLTAVRFGPYSDVLSIGHAKGLSSILVPGAGEPNFDSSEADPFENKKGRQEREVRALLDKIQPELITLDDDFAGRLASQSSIFDNQENLSVPSSRSNAPVMPSFSSLSRLDRLKVSGKAVLPESEAQDDSSDDEHDESAERSRIPLPTETTQVASVGEKKLRRRQRGKGRSLARYLRKKRKNVIDASSIAIRRKIEAQKKKKETPVSLIKGSSVVEPVQHSALNRFRL